MNLTSEQLVKKIFGEEANYDDVMAKLDYTIAEKFESVTDSVVEYNGKKAKVNRVSRITLKKIRDIYVKAKKDVNGQLVDNNANRVLDIKAASLIMLDGRLPIKQKFFHWLHWRWMAYNGDYTTYFFNGVLKKVENNIEQLFFFNNLDSVKNIAMGRMNKKVQAR